MECLKRTPKKNDFKMKKISKKALDTFTASAEIYSIAITIEAKQDKASASTIFNYISRTLFTIAE